MYVTIVTSPDVVYQHKCMHPKINHKLSKRIFDLFA